MKGIGIAIAAAVVWPLVGMAQSTGTVPDKVELVADGPARATQDLNGNFDPAKPAPAHQATTVENDAADATPVTVMHMPMFDPPHVAADSGLGAEAAVAIPDAPAAAAEVAQLPVPTLGADLGAQPDAGGDRAEMAQPAPGSGGDGDSEIATATAEPPVPGDAAEPESPAATETVAMATDTPSPVANAEPSGLEAGAEIPTPATAPEPPAADPNAQNCIDLAGPANAGVPAGAKQAAAHRTALAAAATACLAAAEDEGASPEVLFLASEVAQGKRDVANAFALLERAVAQEFAPAETRIGDYYLFGLAPGGEDTTKAIEHYQRAVELGDPAGMTTLALMYRVGKGVPRDSARMVDLLGQASDAGYHFAQYRLAQTYLNGEGIAGRSDAALGIPNPARAAALFTSAAEGGNITAALELAALYADPASGLPDNPTEQARLTLMASRAGLPDAIAAMGVLYETGRGVEANPGVAALLYVRALESGKVGFDTLRNGAARDWDIATAKAFQKLLQARGLYDGLIDGVVGPGTAGAARALAVQ